jgi:hypothetical protein
MSYHATSRSNYFAVVDAGAFRAALASLGPTVTLFEGEGAHAGKFMLAGNGDDGAYPTVRVDPREEEDEEVDVPDLVAGHLPPGEVAVFMLAGADRLRFVVGWAVAIDHTGERVEVDLNQIFHAAQAKFGVMPTTTQY